MSTEVDRVTRMKKQFVQSMTTNAKYLFDKDFLKPVKKKGRKKKKKSSRKTLPRQEPSMSKHNYQQILRLLESQRSTSPSTEDRDETPAWAKLARASTVPNKRPYY